MLEGNNDKNLAQFLVIYGKQYEVDREAATEFVTKLAQTIRDEIVNFSEWTGDPAIESAASLIQARVLRAGVAFLRELDKAGYFDA